jgi:hypothetical protein
MSYFNISLIGAVAIFGAAIGIQHSKSLSTSEQAGETGLSTSIAMQSVRGTDTLPVQDFDDRSLVFPREASR